MEINIIFALITFVIVFVFTLTTNLNKLNVITGKKIKKEKKKVEKKIEIIEIRYLTAKFDLNEKKLFNKKCVLVIALLNAFIISITAFVTFLIKVFIWQMLTGLVMVLGLIYSTYDIYGRILKKRGNK